VVCKNEKGYILQDSGTFTYNGDQALRNLFRSTRSHNTVEVDRTSQAQPRERFSWHSLPYCSNQCWRIHEQWQWISASHNAFSGLIHWRGVLFVDRSFWLIFDQLKGSGAPEAIWSFHLGPRQNLKINKDRVDIESNFSLFLLLAQASGDLIDPTNSWKVQEDRFSPGYGLCVDSLSVNYELLARLPFRSLILVYPEDPEWLAIRKLSCSSAMEANWSIQSRDRIYTSRWNYSGGGLIEVSSLVGKFVYSFSTNSVQVQSTECQ
jgi:hypothetical protein